MWLGFFLPLLRIDKSFVPVSTGSAQQNTKLNRSRMEVVNSFMTEAVIIQKPGFYMITASVMKELTEIKSLFNKTVYGLDWLLNVIVLKTLSYYHFENEYLSGKHRN